MERPSQAPREIADRVQGLWLLLRGRLGRSSLRGRGGRPARAGSRRVAKGPVRRKIGTHSTWRGCRRIRGSRQLFQQYRFATGGPAARRSPWQNGYAERLIGSIRRECLDHVVVFGERRLRHVLLSYMKYHNEIRTHLSLEKDAPVSRAVKLAGTILCRPVLGGLHHQYVRI